MAANSDSVPTVTLYYPKLTLQPICTRDGAVRPLPHPPSPRVAPTSCAGCMRPGEVNHAALDPVSKAGAVSVNRSGAKTVRSTGNASSDAAQLQDERST